LPNQLDSDVALGSMMQQGRSIAIDSPLGPDVLLLTSVEGEDKLSSCFVYAVEFLTRAPDADIRGLIGQSVTIWLNNQDTAHRQPVNGYIRRVIDMPTRGTGLYAYRAEVVPRLWFLDCASDCRIFQDMACPDIVREVLQDYGVDNVAFRLFKADYPVAEYCVQYRESALAFISRLMENAGIFYFHEHTGTAHTLVITDMNQFTAVMDPEPLQLASNNTYGTIHSVATDTSFRPGAWTLNDYDFTGPTKLMRQNVQTIARTPLTAQCERYDFPGGYTSQDAGQWLTQLRLEEEEAQTSRLFGTATNAAMRPGYRFQFDRHDTGTASTYLLTEVRQSARDSSYFNNPNEAPSGLRTEFVAIDATVPFRPARVTPKSIMRGSQTATVVTDNPNDPILVDEYGRVKVHFHWDRRGNPNTGNTSCWVRVSQNSAGAGFGGIATPHAGQEVVVDFLEGDPDRPLIVGRVHNSDKFPPLDVPAHKNKTITRDHGGNKFVMDGQNGGRHMTMMAPGKLNMFALGKSAEGLSSDTNLAFGLSDLPGIGPGSNGGYSLPGILINPNFGNYQDLQNAINEAFSKDSTSLNQSDTDGVENSDSNSVTDHNSNSFKGGNNNSWTMGWSCSYNGLGSLTVTMADSTSFVFGLNTSAVAGMDMKGVLGFSLSMVAGWSCSYVMKSAYSRIGNNYTSVVKGTDSKLVSGGSTTSIEGPILKYNKGAMLDYRNGNVLDMRQGVSMEWKQSKVELLAPGGDGVKSLELTLAELQEILLKDPSLANPAVVGAVGNAVTGGVFAPLLTEIGVANTQDTAAAAKKAKEAIAAGNASSDMLVAGSKKISVGGDLGLSAGADPAALKAAVDTMTAAACAQAIAKATEASLKKAKDAADALSIKPGADPDDLLAAQALVDATQDAFDSASLAASTAVNLINQAILGNASIEVSAIGEITMRALMDINISAMERGAFAGDTSTMLGMPGTEMVIAGAAVNIEGDTVNIVSDQIMLG
jgi:type VI secretion system secreted protein VgrG